MKHKSIVITNSLESSMVREAEVTIPTYAQKEVGVASTKAFTCQLLSLANLALEVGRMEKTISNQIYKMNIGLLTKLPSKIEKLIKEFTPSAKIISKKLAQANACYFIGRNIAYPIALEGSLKLKEISYMHSEGFPGGEMKHGPIGEIKVIKMPKENIIDTPFIYTIPLQLISYYFALNEGTDIDQPRNLAKSVTVE